MIMVDWTKPLKLTDGREVELHMSVPNRDYPKWMHTDFTRMVVQYPPESGRWTYILYAREDGTTHDQPHDNPNFRVVNR